MIKKISLLLICTASAFAQVELMSNNWPTDPQGFKFYPDSSITFVSRVTDLQTGLGKPGVFFKAKIKQYAGWGFHTHEVEHGTFISRHDPVFPTPAHGETGISDAGGYLNTDVELSGYAGGYTFCHQVTDSNFVIVYAEKCINIITKYTTGFRTNQVPLQRYSGGVGSFDVDHVNQQQILHPDTRHLSGFPPYPNTTDCALVYYPEGAQFCTTDYTTHWVTPTAHLQLLGASAKYKKDSAALGSADLLDITRISLPDGGVYDNDVAGIAPGTGGPNLNWDTRTQEEHMRGIEADVTLATVPLQNKQFEALYFANCRPGINDPYGVPIVYNPPDPFWKTQGVIHVNCIGTGPGTGLKKPIGR